MRAVQNVGIWQNQTKSVYSVASEKTLFGHVEADGFLWKKNGYMPQVRVPLTINEAYLFRISAAEH
jgi:hypothetical protein